MTYRCCLSVGYAACHWCHVMAHESFEDEALAAYLNEHYVAVKVDREERPDVDAVYMAATQALTGHGGWPMTVFVTPTGRAVLRRHLLPAAAAPRPALVRSAARGDQRHVDARPRAGARGRGSHHDRAGRAADRARRRGAGSQRGAARRRPVPSTALASAVRRGAGRVRRRAEVPAVDGARAAAAPSRAHRRRPCARHGRGHVRGDGSRRHVRPARRRLRALLGRRRVGRAALREDALRQRAAAARLPALVARDRLAARGARRARDRRVPAARPALARGRLRLRARRRHRGRRGQAYAWTPEQLVDVLGVEDGERAAPLLARHRARHLRARRVGAAAAPRSRRRAAVGRRTPAAARRARRAACSRVATTRSSRRGTAWRSRRSPRRVRCWRSRGGSTPPRPPPTCSSPCTSTTRGRLRRVSRDGAVGAHAGVLDDYACVADGLLVLHQVTGDGAWLDAGRAAARRGAAPVPRRRDRRLLRHRGRRRGARPASAGPVRQRQPVRLVGGDAGRCSPTRR